MTFILKIIIVILLISGISAQEYKNSDVIHYQDSTEQSIMKDDTTISETTIVALRDTIRKETTSNETRNDISVTTITTQEPTTTISSDTTTDESTTTDIIITEPPTTPGRETTESVAPTTEDYTTTTTESETTTIMVTSLSTANSNEPEDTTDTVTPEPVPEGSDSTTEETTTPITTISTPITTPIITITTPVTTADPCIMEHIIDLTILPKPFSLHLMWNSSNDGCNYKYVIKWSHDEKNFTKNEKEYEITGLEACTPYTITLVTLYNEEELSSITRTPSTLETTPGPVNDLQCVEDIGKIIVNWTPPSTGNQCVNMYRYNIYRDDELVFGSASKIMEILSFSPQICVNHTYEIFPVIDVNDDGPKMNVTYRTAKANDPPTLVGPPIIGTDFVTMTWHVKHINCELKQLIINCTALNEKDVIEKIIIDNKETEIIANLTTLKPFTNYTCYGMLENTDKTSDYSKGVEISTLPKAPSPPQQLSITEDGNSLIITWEEPETLNGELEEFNVSVLYLGPTYQILEGCENEFINTSYFEPVALNSTTTRYEFLESEPSTKYKISVKAKTNGGWSDPEEKMITTMEGVPDSFDMSIKINNPDKENERASLDVMWSIPCKINGHLKKYRVELEGSRSDFQRHNESRSDVICKLKKEYNETKIILLPNYNYNVTVYLDFTNNSAKNETSLPSPDGIPEDVRNQYFPSPDFKGIDNPQTQAKVYIPLNLFNESNGEIKFYAIIVAEEECEEEERAGIYTDWPEIKGKNCVKDEKAHAYQATQKKWQPFKDIKTVDRNSVIEFILGGEIHKCVNETELYCNRPLSPNTNYSVKIRGFTGYGFRDTSLRYFVTESEETGINVGLVVGLIVGILAVAIICATILFYTNGRLSFKNWSKMQTQMSPTPLPVPIKKFDMHFKKMSENPGKIKSEFQLLSTISSDVTLSTKTALLPANKKKNRYVNILPYDETRVTLRLSNSSSSDYINASYIKGYSGNIEYIATQGPTESTCPSFWEMILEQDVNLIVMLTQFVEMGKEKCFKYFPDVKEEFDVYNEIKIQCVEEHMFPIYNQRLLHVIKDDITKEVTHVQFNLWPDFGVPKKVTHMLDFCDAIREIRLRHPGLVVMHCSAGVGRTGTLIAVDILLEAIKDKRKVDIFGTVFNLRKQRMNMVQSERQYEFLYKCVHQAIMKKGNMKSSSGDLNQISESNM